MLCAAGLGAGECRGGADATWHVRTAAKRDICLPLHPSCAARPLQRRPGANLVALAIGQGRCAA